MVAKKRKAPQSRQTTVRHLWLASLGLARRVQRKASALGGQLLGAATGRKGTRRQSR